VIFHALTAETKVGGTDNSDADARFDAKTTTTTAAVSLSVERNDAALSRTA